MPKRIIVCDDEIHITRAISMKLSKAGYQVEAFPDGQSAWEAVQASPPDLVITDLQMPRMNGSELCQHIRDLPEAKQIPVLMLTAKGFELNEQQMMESCGVTEMLTKPFSPRDLLQCVQQHLP